ncbi:MAG: hypothetical protein ACYTKD_13425 [Planctomycetota bacterium]|jgi:hypothetical protein
MKMPKRLAAVLVAACLASGGCFGTRHRQAGIKGGGRVVALEVTGLSMMGVGALTALFAAAVETTYGEESTDVDYTVPGALVGVGAVLCLAGEAIDGSVPGGPPRAMVVVSPVGASLAFRF